jgi:hypothetical protein
MLQTVSKSLTGNGTTYIGTRLRGRILAIKVVADSDVTNNWDLDLTGETTGITIFSHDNVPNNATTWYFPRQLADDSGDESAATDAYVEIPVVTERIKCVAANAGATGSITVTVIIDSDT